MISKLALSLILIFFNIVSHAEEKCDWLFVSEQVQKNEQLILESLSVDWNQNLESFRQLSNKSVRQAYLRKLAIEVEEKLKARANRPALHYNLHGGHWLDYLKRGGIIATQGDVSLQYGRSGDSGFKVYSFNLESHSLYDALTAKNPQFIFMNFRYGNTLLLFDLDSTDLNAYRQSGLIQSEDDIKLDFGSRQPGEFYGVPSTSFMIHPLRLFAGLHKKIGPRRLNYDEKTLFALLMLENAIEI